MKFKRNKMLDYKIGETLKTKKGREIWGVEFKGEKIREYKIGETLKTKKGREIRE